jgi:hypothetical protein
MCERCFPHGLPAEIRDSYLNRHWTFEKDRQRAGTIEHLILRREVTSGKPFWEGVEKLRLLNGKTAFRFMYFAKQKRDKKWVWGQFCPIYSPHSIKDIVLDMKKRGWLKF